jgi:hypothetical protein
MRCRPDARTRACQSVNGIGGRDVEEHFGGEWCGIRLAAIVSCVCLCAWSSPYTCRMHDARGNDAQLRQTDGAREPDGGDTARRGCRRAPLRWAQVEACSGAGARFGVQARGAVVDERGHRR